MEAQLSYINLSEISASATNPRKFFDQSKIDELADSIAAHGVIQPIRLRPKGKHYELVCGERRFRASKQANRKNIPAVISELTDQEVREIQLIENFQREDPHPMEEAVAILAATATGQYTVDDLANKVGKSKKYIAQRLKLNDLIPELQKIFFENKINVSGALKLVTISAEDQLAYSKNYKESAWNADNYYTVSNIEDYIDQCQGNLSNAVFDLADPTLSPKFGACITCPFNSRNANLLFPDDTKEDVCMNHQDYLLKTQVHFDRAVKQATEDPTVVLINTAYGTMGEAEVKRFAENGHPVLNRDKDFELVDAPEMMEVDEEDYETKEEYQEAIIEARAEYEEELVVYEEKQKSGSLVKALVVAGYDKGATVLVELKRKGASIQSGALPGSNSETLAIDQEIARIKEKEERSKELDQEKIYKQVAAALPAHEPLVQNEAPLQHFEMIALAIAVISQCGFDAQKAFKKSFGNLDLMDHNHMKLFNTMLSRGDAAVPQINKLLRQFILHKNTSTWEVNPLKQANPATIQLLAKHYIPDTVQAAEEEQKGIAERRSSRVQARLSELNTQKEKLLAQSKPTKGKGKKSAK